MVDFNNARLNYQNFSFGPDDGRVYSIDHSAGVMYVKNDPGGVPDTPVSLVKTIPLSSSIYSEVQTLEYDGYYFWSQNSLGSSGEMGTRIEKWELSDTGNTLVKVPGAGNEFTLVTLSYQKYQSEAMCVEVLLRELDDTVFSGTNVATISDVSLVELGDEIYLGPNLSNKREVRTVVGIDGQDLTLNETVDYAYSIGDEVRVRKSLWVFNNYHGIDGSLGQLREYSTYTGNPISAGASAEWRGVTAASCRAGSLYYTRGAQLLRYKPHGTDRGYKSSALLENMKNDHNSVIKIFDIEVDEDAVHKLQKTLHQFNTVTKQFEDIDSTDEKYNIDREFLAPKVKSITAHREDNSVTLGNAIQCTFTIELRDQYFVPILGRAVTIAEDDVSGFIEAGYESFTTDSQGQGVTIYNTGASPEFYNPTITVIDVLTDLRGKFLLEQREAVDNLTFTEQVQSKQVSTFVNQRLFKSDLLLTQSQLLQLDGYVEQTQERKSRVLLTQHTVPTFRHVHQIIPATNEIPLEQYPFIETTTAITQYTFLVFAIPTPYSKKNNPYTDILVRIVGFGSLTLDISTLRFLVNNIDVTDQIISEAFTGGLQLTYQNPDRFEYGERVSVKIEIQDDDDPSNLISTAYYFDIVRDFRKPYLSDVYPPNDSVGNSESTEVYAIITDLETGIDTDSIEMYIEGRLVPHIVTELSDTSVKVSYTTTCNYIYKTKITAAVLAVDNSGNKFVGSWSFYIQDSPGVLYISTVPEDCQVLVPVESELCSEVFGLEEGVRIDALTFDLNGVEVQYVLKPKVYRKG